jgi:hypothetical protein
LTVLPVSFDNTSSGDEYGRTNVRPARQEEQEKASGGAKGLAETDVNAWGET